MKLLTLSLENFQGIKNLKLEINGKNASIFGDNETGKTTVFNAFTWLLFDKSSTNVKNFTPKTKGKDGEGVHHLSHSVEATLIGENGIILRLKKVYKEDWVTKRGSAERQFSGHTTDYYVDEVPYQKHSFDNFITQYIGEDYIPRLLTQLDYFPEELSWQERREILLDICGDITDEEVISKTDALSDLKGYLLKTGTTDQYHTVDDFIAIAKVQKKKFTDDIEEIDARIKEVEYLTPDIQGLSAKDLDVRLKELENQKQSKLNLKSGEINGNPELNKCKRELIALMSEELEASKKYYRGNSTSHNQDIDDKIQELKGKRAELEEKLFVYRNELNKTKNDCENKKRNREWLLEEYAEAQAAKWDNSQEVCPTCKRELEADKIEQLKAEFNVRRSRMLEEINNKGKEFSKEKIGELESKATELQNSIDDMMQSIEQINQVIKEVASEKTEAKWEETDEYGIFKEKIGELESKATELEAELLQGASAFDEAVKAIDADISALQDQKLNIKKAKEFKQRIKDLEADEKSLTRKLSHIEKGIHLCEVFKREKVKLLDNKINSKFKRVRFQLFKDQVNGGLQDACEVLVPTKDGKLVPYSTDANNAAKINAGLEIIDVLNKHYDIHLPVFVDNAESVTRLLKIDTQVIKLVVSEQDKKLRMEVINNE